MTCYNYGGPITTLVVGLTSCEAFYARCVHRGRRLVSTTHESPPQGAREGMDPVTLCGDDVGRAGETRQARGLLDPREAQVE